MTAIPMTSTAMVPSAPASGVQQANSVQQANGTHSNTGVQASPRGSVSPAIITDEHRQILRQMVDRNASPAQVEMLIVIGNRYDLDPLMGHVVLINGKCFVTHKGLMHKAHASGQFDGIETQYGRDDLGEYCECHVYRKDMTRPFSGRIYIDEYRSAGPVWKQYPRAMAAKTAESFVLRRTFDVALASQEEMGVADAPPPQRVFPPEERAERRSLGEKITAATKVLTRQQFDAFKEDVAGRGGLPSMETEDLRKLLAQVEDVASANVAGAETDAQQAKSLQTKGVQQAKSLQAPVQALNETEDDPFADDADQPELLAVAAEGPALAGKGHGDS